VTASFSSDSQNVCVNSSIQFTDTSLGGPTTWNWTFPGGSPANSADANPLVTYATPGTYDVSLTVTNGALNDTETLTGYLTVTPSNTYYEDLDGDGFGSSNSIIGCSPQGDFNVTITGDCNDNDVNINPGASESCDGIDNNCDSQIDEGVSQITYYEDLDGDGFGSSNSILNCSPQGDFNATSTGDCNDNDANINPSSSEICGNNLDDNCDSLIDENQNTYYADSDLDGFGDLGSPILACNTSSGIVNNSIDCEDTNSNIYPNAPGSMEGLDNDCNGTIEGDELAPASCPGDFDGNNMVNITDLLVMLEVYGCNTGDCPVDMNGDGLTTIEDIGLFLSFFGSTCN
jgi:PKD repeat protein